MCFAKVLLVVLVLTSVMLNATRVEAAPSKASCKQERKLFVSSCLSVMNKKPASPACCKRVRVSSFDCICPVITPALAALVDVNYAARVLRGCGRRVPRHYKCGSITLP